MIALLKPSKHCGTSTKNNRRTMTILSAARRLPHSYLLFTCRRKRLVLIAMRCSPLPVWRTHAAESPATFVEVHGETNQSFSYWVWHRYRNHSDSHSPVLKEEAENLAVLSTTRVSPHSRGISKRGVTLTLLCCPFCLHFFFLSSVLVQLGSGRYYAKLNWGCSNTGRM